MSLHIQAITMLHMLVAGIYLGASFDTYARLFYNGHKRFWTFIQDILFWLCSGLLVFLWLRTVNAGEMRITILLSLLCGYALYRSLLEKVYLRLLEAVIYLVVSLYRFIAKTIYLMLILPLKWCYQALIAILGFILGVVYKIVKFLYRILIKLVRPFHLYFVEFWKKRWKKQNKNEAEGGVLKKGFFSQMANWLKRRKKKRK